MGDRHGVNVPGERWERPDFLVGVRAPSAPRSGEGPALRRPFPVRPPTLWAALWDDRLMRGTVTVHGPYETREEAEEAVLARGVPGQVVPMIPPRRATTDVRWPA